MTPFTNEPRFSFRRVATLSAIVLALLLADSAAHAQRLSADITERCVHAAVKIVMLSDAGRGGSTGSGSMIDARGYVLTNFHVVGHVHPETGQPGTLLNAANRVLLATVDSARQAARPRWRGVVVRADAQLDLALVRILGDTDGNRVEGTPFQTIEMAGTEELRPGSKVWAFGFPLGVRTINVTEGSVAGFQMNARDEVAWLRSDAEFNPGNSGGMLVDQEGRLIGVPTRVFHGRGRALEPVELARPVERMPAAWLSELREGHITDTQITGVGRLVAGSAARGYAQGDNGSVGAPDQHFYVLPDPPRPATIRTRPGLPIALLNGNDVIREARGELELQEGDPEGVVLSLLIPRASERAVSYVLEMVSEATPEAEAAPTEAPPQQTTFVPPQTDTRANGVAVRGLVRDASSGLALPNAWVVIGRPGVNLRERLDRYLAGRLSESDLHRDVVATTRTDVGGRYSFSDLPPGNYPAAALARDHRAAVLNLSIGSDDPVVELPPIRLQR